MKRRQQLGVLAVQQLTDRGMTLGEWIVKRWTPEHAVTLEQTTRDRYANAHALHIAPALDDVPLRYVAAQLGHSPVLTLSTYGHLIAEYAEAAQIDAEREIILARDGRPGEALVQEQAGHIG